MAEEKKTKKKENEEAAATAEGEDAQPKRRKLFAMGGGVVALVCVAWAASLMAVPSDPEMQSFAGPFVAPLSSQKIQVNLKGESGRRYLVMSLNAVYDAYQEAYVSARLSDALYQPLLLDAIIDLGSRKDREQVTSSADREVFKQELRDAVDPILFPVHVGDATTPYDRDEESGVGPGESVYGSTLRGPHHLHRITVDAPARTLRLDDGAEIAYTGSETDLELVGPTGRVVYVDVTGVDPEFQGEVPVGVHGRVRRVTFSELLVQ